MYKIKKIKKKLKKKENPMNECVSKLLTGTVDYLGFFLFIYLFSLK